MLYSHLYSIENCWFYWINNYIREKVWQTEWPDTASYFPPCVEKVYPSLYKVTPFQLQSDYTSLVINSINGFLWLSGIGPCTFLSLCWQCTPGESIAEWVRISMGGFDWGVAARVLLIMSSFSSASSSCLFDKKQMRAAPPISSRISSAATGAQITMAMERPEPAIDADTVLPEVTSSETNAKVEWYV